MEDLRAPDVDGELPYFRLLHRRHRGLPEKKCGDYYDAFTVAMWRHHRPPSTVFVVRDGQRERRWRAHWESPPPETRDGYANSDDCTRDAAYAMALATIEAERSLVAFSQARAKSGADFILVDPSAGIDLLETAVRLEVAGQDKGDAADLRKRLTSKMRQARSGKSDRPALAAVVGFQASMVVVSEVEGT